MCGIIGYVGDKDAWPVVLGGLRRVEYRGYDSAGIATIESGRVAVSKAPGKLEVLAARSPVGGRTGIGHTRWATHGKPNEVNAHPHASCDGRLAVVHNGIIENHAALRAALEKEGHKFRSETDTEVVAHLAEKFYRGDLLATVLQVLREIHGTYALVFLHADEPNRIVAARKESPLVIGLGTGEGFVASDVPALLEHTRRVIYLEDDHVAVVSKKGAEVYDLAGLRVEAPVHEVTWTLQDAEKGGFAHFMLKEIFDTPKAIHEVLLGRIHDITRRLELEGALRSSDLVEAERITLLACGTSYHACLLGKRIFEKMARVPVAVEVASEYRFADTVSAPGEVVIAVSQSGETMDTLGALKKARTLGYKTLAVTNVVGSSITRAADGVFMLRAGPEISVAATKSFVNQTLAFYLLGLHVGAQKGTLRLEDAEKVAAGVRNLPRLVQQVLDQQETIAAHGRFVARHENAFYIGRQMNHATALEGALKLKEVSYIHAEGFPAGELKHGPLALLGEASPVVALLPKDHTYDVMASNIGEVRARDAPVIAVAQEGDTMAEQIANHVLWVPRSDPLLYPVPASVALQLLAYYAALERDCPIDKPRNLAKSVTVE
ncbi:MAG: glutamine--fructose-6-phosphate transaminase (isomerizing) [Methanobacteriota archaeon]